MKRIAAGVLLLACWHPLARAQDEMEPARLYARGERAEALAALFGRGENRREFDLEAIRRTRDGALLRAALMLHTDRALLEHVQAPVTEIARKCGLTEEDDYLLEVAKSMIDRGELKDFMRRWFVALALRSQWDLCLEDVSFWVARGLKWYPKDPALLLVRGSAEEAAAQLRYPDGVAPQADERSPIAVSARITNSLHQARKAYEGALAADPGLVEARLRLGRTRWRLGQLDEARTDLERVTHDAAAPPVAYLAHLFLARVYDDTARASDAEREYRAALAVDPAGQAAAVGLAQLLGRRSGSAGRELLVRALEHAPRRERDLYWAYPAAFGSNGEDELAALRDEASP